MPQTIRTFCTQVFLGVCVGALAGCQVTTNTGQYRTWLSWRAVFQPALVYERQRPQGPPGTCLGGLRQACLVNWNDRTFVDPRSLPTRAVATTSVAPNSSTLPKSPDDETRASPSDVQSPDTPASGDVEPEQLPPPAPSINGPELLPRPKFGPSASNVSQQAKSSRPGMASPDTITRTGRDQAAKPARSLWSRLFRRSEDPEEDEEESDENSDAKKIASPSANRSNAFAGAQSSLSNRGNPIGRQAVDSNSGPFEVIAPRESDPPEQKPVPAPTFWNRLWRRKPEPGPNADGNFQRPGSDLSAANQPAQVPQVRGTFASAVNGRRADPFGADARPSGSPENPLRQQPAAEPGPVRRLWNRLRRKDANPDVKTPEANAPDADEEAPLESDSNAGNSMVTSPSRERPKTLRALLSRPAPAAEPDDPELDDPDLDDEEMNEPDFDRRK